MAKQLCQFIEFRRGQAAPDAVCPACGVKEKDHVRECDECHADIAPEDVEEVVYDGKLLCDDCIESLVTGSILRAIVPMN